MKTSLLQSSPMQNIIAPVISIVAPIDLLLKNYTEYQALKNKLLNDGDYQVISGKQYMKKSGYRKIALAFGISTEITHQERQDLKDYFVYTVTVKATAPNGRYMTASGACSSMERKFAHIDHDCYAQAGTRATNRAISDLLGTGECSYEELITEGVDENIPSQKHLNQKHIPDSPYTRNIQNNHRKEDTPTTKEPITIKQRSLLIRLIESKFSDEKIRSGLFNRLTNLSKGEARVAIQKMLA